MKLTLADTKYLKESVNIISDLVTEARFKVTPDAIELIAMDPANVALVIYKLLSSAFTEYDVKDAKTLALNLNDFKQVLRRVKPEDSLTMELTDGKLKITLEGRSTRTFHMPLLDTEEREQKVPNLEFGATITMPARYLTDAVEDVDIIGESVQLSLLNGKFNVSAAGDTSKAEVDLHADDDLKVVGEDNHKAKYSIEYLKKMIQGSKLADQAVVKFSNDYPLRLEFTVLNKLQLAFVLAPRVDND